MLPSTARDNSTAGPARWPGRGRLVRVVLTVALTMGVAAACSGNDGKTTITFFQFKPEAQQYFQQLAKSFEKTHPKIKVVVDNPADPETALRTRLVKNDPPDVMTLNANGTFGEFATAKIFKDFSSDPVLQDVNPAYLTILRGVGSRRRSTRSMGCRSPRTPAGCSTTSSCSRKYHVAVPRTFDQLVAAAKTFKAHQITPFYGMLKDAWTAQSPLAPLSAQLQPENFFIDRFQDKTTFAKGLGQHRDRARRAVPVHPARPAVAGLQRRHCRVRRRASPRCCCSAATRFRRSGRTSPSSPSAAWRCRRPTTPPRRAWSAAWTWCSPPRRHGAHPEGVGEVDRLPDAAQGDGATTARRRSPSPR